MSAVPDDRWSHLLGAAERAEWRLDEVLSEDAELDFERPFLPAALSGERALGWASGRERLALNHVRAHGYLALFGIVEEMILPFVLQQTLAGELCALDPVRALLTFASEEAKHIALFRRFARVFERGFGRPVPAVGPASAFARAVLGHGDLGVALAILHIEWMTQEHWLACVRDDEAIEPAFKQLLRFHWLEEARHARLDALLVERLASGADPAERERGLDDYLAIVVLIDEALAAQVQLDRRSFERATGRRLDEARADELCRLQHAAQRQTFLASGMRHPRFVAALAGMGPGAIARVQSAVRSFDLSLPHPN
jgi:hypothetical protein